MPHFTPKYHLTTPSYTLPRHPTPFSGTQHSPTISYTFPGFTYTPTTPFQHSITPLPPPTLLQATYTFHGASYIHPTPLYTLLSHCSPLSGLSSSGEEEGRRGRPIQPHQALKPWLICSLVLHSTLGTDYMRRSCTIYTSSSFCFSSFRLPLHHLLQETTRPFTTRRPSPSSVITSSIYTYTAHIFVATYRAIRRAHPSSIIPSVHKVDGPLPSFTKASVNQVIQSSLCFLHQGLSPPLEDEAIILTGDYSYCPKGNYVTRG